MTMSRTKTMLIGMVLGVAASLSLITVMGSRSHDVGSGDDRERPQHLADWINDDGTVNEEKTPEIVPVYGTDGKVVTRDGVEMGIRYADLDKLGELLPPADVDGKDELQPEPFEKVAEDLLVPLKG